MFSIKILLDFLPSSLNLKIIWIIQSIEGSVRGGGASQGQNIYYVKVENYVL